MATKRKPASAASSAAKRPAKAPPASETQPPEPWVGPKARIAVAGAGWWTQGWHLPHLQRNPGSEITAIIEPNPHPKSTLNKEMKSTVELGQLYGVPVFSTIDEFLKSEALKVTDGLIVCTSHATHYDVASKAMEAGLHILMEKPMTTDPEEAHKLVELAASTDKVFMVNTSANYREQAQKAHELVTGGTIGKVRHVSCSMASALLWLFDDPANEGWVKPVGKMVGNGFGWGQLSHTLAWVYLVTGLTPSSVFCSMGYSEKTGADIYDSGVIRCTCGATINVQGIGSLVFKSYTESGKQIENRIFGDKGMLMYSGEDYDPTSGDLVVRRHDGNHDTYPGFYFENYSAEGDGPESLQKFIRGCVGKPFFNGSDVHVSLKVVQTIDAMYRSARSGQSETVA